jgi:guanylate kinase
VHYHYKQIEDLQQMAANGKFIEHAIFSGNFYGSSFSAVQDVLQAGKNVILDIDMQGVIQLQQRLKKEPALLTPALYVFVAPPSYEELEKRLRNRGTEDEASLEKRLAAAKKELEWGNKPGSCDYIIVNNDVDVAYSDLLSLLKKEKIIS